MVDENQVLLEVTGLQKVWSDQFSLKTVDLLGARGQVLGVLGHNGSGKTTFFELISGNLDPTSGSTKICGEPVGPEYWLTKKKVGYLSQTLNFPQWVSGEEILRYVAALRGLDKSKSFLDGVIQEWGCEAFIRRPVGAYSHGMEKRIGLALATMHEPELLILDEPFSGLDLYHIRTLHTKILERSKQGLLTILSTHILSYVARLCDRVFILSQGSLVSHESWGAKSFEEKIDSLEQHFFSGS